MKVTNRGMINMLKEILDREHAITPIKVRFDAFLALTKTLDRLPPVGIVNAAYKEWHREMDYWD